MHAGLCLIPLFTLLLVERKFSHEEAHSKRIERLLNM